MFRPFRRSGPPPFQVMSNSWRGPSRSTPKPGEAPRAEAAPVVEQAAPVAGAKPIAAPVASPIAEVPRAIALDGAAPKSHAADRNSPKATIEVRRRGDAPAPQKSFDAARLTQPIAKGAAWLGGLTLALGAAAGERMRLLGRKLRGRSNKGHSMPAPLPRQTVVLGFASLAVIVVAIVWFTRDRSPATTAVAPGTELAVSDTNLSAIRPAEPLPIQPPSRQGSAHIPARPTPPIALPVAPIVDAQPKPKLSRLAVDPRDKGQRYYILATYSVNKEAYLMPLLEYLWSQGVEAAAINAHNSGFFQVVALQGFTRDEINSKAHKQYEETLRRIGRKWKAEGGGDDNLQGLYLQEYSGAQAKLSITKAN